MIWDYNEDIKVIRCQNNRKNIHRLLIENREERRPYVFITDTMTIRSLSTILVPISRLEEEVYKAEICSYLARKANVQCLFLCAKDYGTKAKINTSKIIAHLNKVSEQTGFHFSYTTIDAKKNSDGIIDETVARISELHADLIVLTASREYGLDDIFFGPPELHAIKKSSIPIMLINPRTDLFSLCD